MKIPYCTGCGEYPGDFVADEIETLRARIAELENKLEGMADLAQGEFSRAEKAEAHIVELDRELINIRRSRRKAEAALTEARARLAAADRMAYWLDKLHEEGNGQIAEISQLLYEWETGQ